MEETQDGGLPEPVFLTDKLFEELVTLWHQQEYIPDDLIETTSQAIYPLALPMRALNAFRRQEWRECLNFCYGFFQFQPVLPNLFIGMMADAARRCKRGELLSWPILQFAEAAIKEGRIDLAMAAIKQIYSFSGDIQMLELPPFVMRIARDHESISKTLKRPEKRSRNRHRKPRLAMVTSNLVDHVLAYSKTALQFARYVDRKKYVPHLYFTETSIGTRPQEFSIRFESPSSHVSGKDFLQEIKDLNVAHCLVSDLPFSQAAEWLAKQFEEDEIDAVIFQGGINAPIMWAACAIAHVPVKLNLCLGLNMYQPGMDGVVYMNKTNLEREADFWKEEWGRQVFIGGGADIAEAQRTPKPKRSDIDIPEDAVVFGTLTNYVNVRVTLDYLACVADVLEECPNSYFLCMGAGDNSKQREFMKEKGLADRCRWLGQQSEPFKVLKYLDFYLNEFPMGGSQSIRECLACGIPALAMRYSSKHHESVGADIIGAPFAVMDNNRDVYTHRAIEWADDPRRREEAATALFERAKQLYSAENFIHELSDHMASTWRKKRKTTTRKVKSS